MKAYFSAKEIARATGVTQRAVLKMAERKRWEFHLRANKRGGCSVKFFRRKNIPERVLLALDAMDQSNPKRSLSLAIPISRRRQLKKNLAAMIDVAWKSLQFEEWQTLTTNEEEYVRHHIDRIIQHLIK